MLIQRHGRHLMLVGTKGEPSPYPTFRHARLYLFTSILTCLGITLCITPLYMYSIGVRTYVENEERKKKKPKERRAKGADREESHLHENL